MTPFELNILLHYYCRADDWRNGDHNKLAKDTIGRFLDLDLVKHSNFHIERFDDGSLRARYALTDRGKAYVHALMNVPLPEQIWIVPAQPEGRPDPVGSTGSCGK